MTIMQEQPQNLRSAREAIVEDLQRSKKLRNLYLRQAFQYLMEEDHRTGLLMLRDLINATYGFIHLSKELKKSPKSLMRMLSGTTTPRSDNLLQIIKCIASYDAYSSVELKIA